MADSISPHDNFRTEAFLREHIRQTMNFYRPRCIGPAGGFFHYFKDDRRVYDDEKSPAGKTDYHTMGACHDVLPVLRAQA